MKTFTRNTLIATAILGLGLSGIGLVAAGPYGGRGDCMHGAPGAQTMGGQMGMEYRQDRMQQHLDSLRQALDLSPAQQPAWDRFVESRLARVQAMQAERQAMMAQRQAMMSGEIEPESRMALREARMAARDTHKTKARAELEALYAELTPEQQAIAEDLLMRRPGHRHGMQKF